MIRNSKSSTACSNNVQQFKFFQDSYAKIPKYEALVVIGSQNEENDFGIRSGQRVAKELEKLGWIVTVINVNDDLLKFLSNTHVDLIVPIGFGVGSGEDGTISTFAKSLGIPCAGPEAFCGVVCTDKFLFQAIVGGIFKGENQKVGPLYVKTPNTILVSDSTCGERIGHEIRSLGLPILIKPARGGSSIGIQIVNSHNEAISHAVKAAQKGDRVLIQEFISAREVSATLVDLPDGPLACPIVELDKRNSPIMGYEEKFGPSATSRHIIPASFPDDITDAIKTVALKLHDVIGFRGITRLDALVVEDSSELVLLEVNSIAGLLESSIAVDAAYAAGINFSELTLAYALSAFKTGKQTNSLLVTT